jgi:enoyl-CoA hydratase
LEEEVRVVVIRGEGKHFSSGIDFTLIAEVVGGVASLPDGRKHEVLRRKILELQDCFTAAERCRKPVIAEISGACIGGAIDLITACDLRYATAASRFCVKEVDLAIVADVGTLQRLPRLVGEGACRELALTGRTFKGEEAARLGLVNGVFEDEQALRDHVSAVASGIARKSPLTVRGVKQVLNFSREQSVRDGLDYVATWNAAMLISADSQEAMTASLEGREPVFAD